MTLADCNAPVVNRRVRGRSFRWITPAIKDLMKKCDYQNKKAIKTKKEITGAITKGCVTLCR